MTTKQPEVPDHYAHGETYEEWGPAHEQFLADLREFCRSRGVAIVGRHKGESIAVVPWSEAADLDMRCAGFGQFPEVRRYANGQPRPPYDVPDGFTLVWDSSRGGK